ncbi:hypothetical protein Pse7367_0035 [Thalassoporum mexicanum PCC 7367]|uniref:hypothetical protein n=1 Tax=Thalassoporum mexicanum TaxID=3457544 RepID=UPI00029FA944|nr:hypothetical protein [Pseudanabaena sp. PCC 7367]AFY68355.1 hypothetical protein Pse7367_0035 [Pseudanabaena sp. PCC 7367]
MTANLGAADDFEEGVGGGGVTLFGVNLSSRVLGIILGVGLVGVSGWVFLNYTKPRLDRINQAEAEITQKQQSIQNLEAQIASKAGVAGSVDDARDRNRTALSFLPDVDVTDTLLLDLNAQLPEPRVVSNSLASIEFAGALESFTPSTTGAIATEEIDSQFVAQTFSVTFSATYQDTLDYMQRIERLRPLLVVKTFSVEKASTEIALGGSLELTDEQEKAILANFPPLLDTKFTLQTYVAIPEEALLALEQRDREAVAAAAAAAAAEAEAATTP